MKIGKLGSSIKTLIPALQALEATEAATNLNHILVLFNELKDEDAEAFGKAANQLELLPGQDVPLLGSVARSLSAVVNLAKVSGATAARVRELETALACLAVSRLEVVAFSDFAKAIISSLRVDVVALYADALEANLGKPEFDAIFRALETDRRAKKAEVAAIASRFLSKTPKSAPKGQTLQRIYDRHSSLVDSAKKRDQQKGKSAA